MRMIGLMAMAATLAMPVSATAAQYSVSAANGGAYVMRDGSLSAIRTGSTLSAGDRIVTRMGSSVTLSAPGCGQTVAGGAMVTIGQGSCSNLVSNANLAQDGLGADDDDGSGGAFGFDTAVVALAAVVAAGLGIYIAADSDSNDAPISS